jgi:uncharacterized protein
MANAVRKWLPLALIAGAIAATAVAVRDLPATVVIDLRGVLPFTIEPSGDTAPRWVAVVGIPLLATFVWLLFLLGRTRAGLRFTMRLFPGIPDALGDPATIDRFRATYDTIALWVVVLVLGVHAGMIAAALGHEALAPRIIAVVMGISLIATGNVIPRLRPNLVAGVRTRGTLSDPLLWRATHRVLGRAFVIAGSITVVVGLLAPSFGLATAVIALIVACVVAAIGGVRARRIAAAAFVAFVLTVAVRVADAQMPIANVVELPTPATVVEEPFSIARDGLTLHGTLAMPRQLVGPMPVILMVAGSGATDRNANGPMVNTNAYAMLAWSLAEAGFASVRYDKRGIGASRSTSGDPTSLTTDTFVADVLAGAKALGTDTRFSRVFLLGHSEGAGHVLQAANRGAAIAGVIMVSAQGRKLVDLLREQFSRQTDSATVTQIDSAFARYLRGDDPGTVPPIARPIMVPVNRTFMRSWVAYDPEGEARRLRAPLLIVQGSTDVQTTMSDAKLLATAQPAATFVVLDGVNHVLKTVTTTDLGVQLASYRDPRMPLAPGVADAIVRWARTIPH